MKSKPYDHERLASLLRLLRPAPATWVAKAKRISLGPLTAGDLTELTRKLELEPAFRKNFDADPVVAAETAGLRGLAAHMRLELAELFAAPSVWLESVPEVVAHRQEDVAPEVRLRALLVSSKAVVDKLGARPR